MAENKFDFSFLKTKSVLIASVLLILQAGLFYAMPTNEKISLGRPLSELPLELGVWRTVQESEIEPEVQELLRADSTVNRMYAESASDRNLNLFIAFFKTQRAGVSPHSPKVCLPGSGWEPTMSGTVSIPIAGLDGPITVNRYIVARGAQKSVVLYWYQTHNRVIASEYAAKFYLMLDGVRYRRSDTAMIRVVIPAAEGNIEEAEKTGVEFVQLAFPRVKEILPQ